MCYLVRCLYLVKSSRSFRCSDRHFAQHLPTDYSHQFVSKRVTL